MPQILWLNGPNLNLLGKREPEIYGWETLDEIVTSVTALAQDLKLGVTHLQSNREYELIEAIHAARETHQAIIINAGAFSHTSIALLDALNAFKGPVMEVHISNLHKREEFRHNSYIAKRADGVIVGCGSHGYHLAVRHVAKLLGV